MSGIESSPLLGFKSLGGGGGHFGVGFGLEEVAFLGGGRRGKDGEGRGEKGDEKKSGV
jgi:hypothetical protein